MKPRWPRWLLLWVALAVPPGVMALDTSNVVAGSGTIEFAFTPGDDAASRIVHAIDVARVQVLVQAFSFTHEAIAEALVRAHQRGLDVKVIADPEQIELLRQNVVERVAASGVPVFTDAEHAAAHNKVMIIDAGAKLPVLITGSYNFTFAAQYRNAENLLIFRDNRELTREFLRNWERHLAHSRPFPGGAPKR